jgi:hypothetical protein
MPKISVIIPCYNLGLFLDEAVESVLLQSFQDFEIIIVNDGSTDEATNRMLRDYDRPRTKILRTENQGLPSARNNGIRASQGEYVCCLDADDKYYPDFLAKTVGVLDRDSSGEIGFVTTWATVFGEENFVWMTADYNPSRLALANVVHVASLFRKKCWEEAGGYAPNLRAGYEDWNFWLSIVARGYAWSCVKEPLFYYRKRKQSMVASSDLQRDRLFSTIIENNEQFYQQHLKEILLEATRYARTSEIAAFVDRLLPPGTFRRRLLTYSATRLSAWLR